MSDLLEHTTGRFLTNVRPTPVLEELVALASKHTGFKVTYRKGDQTVSEMDWFDAAEAYDTGYQGSPDGASLYYDGPLDIDLGPFWRELERLEGLVKTPLNEPLLRDDYPLVQGYFYVADGQVREFIDGERMTVGLWKSLGDGLGVKEVRRCDMDGRIKRMPEKKETPKGVIAHRWNQSGTTIVQAKRRPRSSNKIRKVK